MLSRFVLPRDAGRGTAAEALADHDEAMGGIVLRPLAQEDRHPSLREMMDHGREDRRRRLQDRFDADLDSGGAKRPAGSRNSSSRRMFVLGSCSDAISKARPGT